MLGTGEPVIALHSEAITVVTLKEREIQQIAGTNLPQVNAVQNTAGPPL